MVADLDGDGTTEVVVGRGHEVIAFEWFDSSLHVKAGWPADTTTGGNPPEVRGMAAADLDGDGTIEVVVTTTQTVPTADGGAQVFVLSPDGSSYQPAGGHVPAWPRYNNLSGPGNDADRSRRPVAHRRPQWTVAACPGIRGRLRIRGLLGIVNNGALTGWPRGA